MFDCHSHFHSASGIFSPQDINAFAIDSKRELQVEGVIVVSENMNDVPVVLKQHCDFPHFYHACLGIHPVQQQENGDSVSANLAHLQVTFRIP